MQNVRSANAPDFSGFDFLDLGCSAGGSLKFAMETLGGRRGLGVDIDRRKVAKTREAGFDAIEMDATQLGDHPNSVSFVVMSHFLEHLPGYGLASQCVRASYVAARDYVFIRQPWFDSDGYLANLGLKFFWSDWRGHSFAITTLDMRKMLRDAGVERWRLYGVCPIKTGADPMLLPLSAPVDQHKYDASRHGPKPTPALTGAHYAETMAILMKSDRVSFEELEAKFPNATLLGSERDVMAMAA